MALKVTSEEAANDTGMLTVSDPESGDTQTVARPDVPILHQMPALLLFHRKDLAPKHSHSAPREDVSPPRDTFETPLRREARCRLKARCLRFSLVVTNRPSGQCLRAFSRHWHRSWGNLLFAVTPFVPGLSAPDTGYVPRLCPPSFVDNLALSFSHGGGDHSRDFPRLRSGEAFSVPRRLRRTPQDDGCHSCCVMCVVSLPLAIDATDLPPLIP